MDITKLRNDFEKYFYGEYVLASFQTNDGKDLVSERKMVSRKHTPLSYESCFRRRADGTYLNTLIESSWQCWKNCYKTYTVPTPVWLQAR